MCHDQPSVGARLANSVSPGFQHCLQASSGTPASTIPPGITKGHLDAESAERRKKRVPGAEAEIVLEGRRR